MQGRGVLLAATPLAPLGAELVLADRHADNGNGSNALERNEVAAGSCLSACWHPLSPASLPLGHQPRLNGMTSATVPRHLVHLFEVSQAGKPLRT